MSAPLITVLSRFTAKFATKTGVLAGVGIMSASGVAAAAVGAPIPVIEEAFESEGPSLVDVEDGAVPEEGEPADDAQDEQGEDQAGEDGNEEPASALDEGEDEEVEDEEVEDEDEDEEAKDEGEEAGVDEGEGVKPDNHGKTVSAAAQTQCGKKVDMDDGAEDGTGSVDEDEAPSEESSEATEEPSADDDAAVEEDCDGREWKNHGEYVSDTARANRDAKAEARGAKDQHGNGKAGKVVEGDEVEPADESTTDDDAKSSKPGKGNRKGGPKANKANKGKNG